MAESDDKSEIEPRMKVTIARKQEQNGNWGCCFDKEDVAYCPWLIHGHLFCNFGCTWEAEGQ